MSVRIRVSFIIIMRIADIVWNCKEKVFHKSIYLIDLESN